jgi:hypothetical protein
MAQVELPEAWHWHAVGWQGGHWGPLEYLVTPPKAVVHPVLWRAHVPDSWVQTCFVAHHGHLASIHACCSSGILLNVTTDVALENTFHQSLVNNNAIV